MIARRRKGRARKIVQASVWNDAEWSVKYGILKRSQGRPSSVPPLFRCIAEKVPFGALDAVEAHYEGRSYGVYVAHDSMGTARYVGRGEIFSRLRARKKSRRHELVYFSFFVVDDKQHEREIETLLIRAAGPELVFNEKKKRVGIEHGRMRDFEPGTRFYERQVKKGRKRSNKRRVRQGRASA